MTIQKKFLPLVLSGLIFVVIVGVGYYSRNAVYYPHVVMGVPNKLVVTFLQQATADSAACEATTATIVSSFNANCPACVIAKQQCLKDLPPDLRKLLSEEPLASPSLRIPNGVVTYASPNPQLAFAVCMQSQTNATSAGQAGQVICNPADTPRPFPEKQKQMVEAAKPAFRYLAQAIAVLGAGFVIFLAVQFFSVRHPTDAEAALPPAETEIKISNLAKRLADILISVILLVLLFPIFVLVSALILILEGPPIFYVSRRFISLNHCVSILKFRTMVKDAESPKYRLRERFMRDGYLDIPLDCEVYTPLGRILERSQLVETLQLFNIIFHGMSLVGNRPLPLENIELLKKFKGWEGRFDSPAGITGISQVVGKFNQKPEERIELECLYSCLYKSTRGNILLSDLFILLYTVRVLFFGKYLSFDEAKRLLMNASGTLLSG